MGGSVARGTTTGPGASGVALADVGLLVRLEAVPVRVVADDQVSRVELADHVGPGGRAGGHVGPTPSQAGHPAGLPGAAPDRRAPPVEADRVGDAGAGVL